MIAVRYIAAAFAHCPTKTEGLVEWQGIVIGAIGSRRSDLRVSKPAGAPVDSLECTFAGLRMVILVAAVSGRVRRATRLGRLCCSRLRQRASFLTRFKTRTHLNGLFLSPPAACPDRRDKEIQARRKAGALAVPWPITAHQVAWRRLHRHHVIARASEDQARHLWPLGDQKIKRRPERPRPPSLARPRRRWRLSATVCSDSSGWRRSWPISAPGCTTLRQAG